MESTVMSSGSFATAGKLIFSLSMLRTWAVFQLLNLGVLGFELELRFWVVIALIVSLTLTIALITTLTII